MNSVSWMIYLAGIAGNLATAFQVLCFFGAIFVLAPLWIISFMFSETDDYVNNKHVKSTYRYFPRMWIGATVASIFWFIFLLGAILTPNSNTILLIATSQFGETFIQSSTGTQVAGLMQDTLKLLQKQIDTQLGKDSKNGN